jgi:hypothetical protein
MVVGRAIRERPAVVVVLWGVLLLGLSSCTPIPVKDEVQPGGDGMVKANIRSVVLVGGLNQDVRSMGEIAALANRSARSVVAVNLEFPEASYKAGNLVRHWRSQVDAALGAGCASSGSEMVAIGWSTGGLLLLDALQRGVLCSGTRVMVVNPPLHLRWYASLIRLLTPLARTQLSLPSLAPRNRRLRSWTPVTMYRAMLMVRDVVRQQSIGAISMGEGVFVLSQRDELVDVVSSAKEVAALFPGWPVKWIEVGGSGSSHAPTTEAGLGEQLWATLQEWFVSSVQSQVSQE